MSDWFARALLKSIHKLTVLAESWRDKQISSETDTDVTTPEDHIPEAISSLRDIADRINTVVGQQKADSQQSTTFQRKSLRVQWWLFAATAAAFLAAAYYAHVARLQKDTMDKQWHTMNHTFQEMQRQTGEAKEANRLTVESERPWIGVSIAIQDWQEGRSATSTVTFTNGGRRPAKLLAARFGNHEYVVLPGSPEYPARQPTDVHSVVLIIPNGTASSAQPLGQVTHDRLDRLGQRHVKFFIYASVDYEDVGTHAKHWTHGCVQYLPGFSNQANGFVSCESYNDVDADSQKTSQ